jgi:Protein of unknown function with HXXEE motif
VTDPLNAVRSRDHIAGAVFVLAAVTAQAHWMGRASVLPMYLIAAAVQCLHFTEEYLTGFQRQFPKLMGYEWSDSRFVAFNMAWLVLFLLAALGVYRRVSLAYLVVLFLALAGGVANGVGHLLLSATQGKYFPGLATAPFCLLAGIGLLTQLFGGTRMRHAGE